MASYVQITREELEDWLRAEAPQAIRSEDHTGVYIIPVSSNVAVYLSTSIGSEDKAVAKGRGACHMKLVSRITDRTLNRKGLQQTRYNRTSGWRKNWMEGMARMVAVYTEHREFYERLALETQEQYAARNIAEIDRMGSSPFLLSLKEQLQKGRWLTTKQEAALAKGKPREVRSGIKLREQDLEVLRKLWVQARDANDEWTKKFVGNVGQRGKAGEPLSRLQLEKLNDKLTEYRIDYRI